MIILGIDPGLQKTGWGLIRSEGSALKFINCGLIEPPKDAPLAERLSVIHHGLIDVIHSLRPDCAAVEETFVNKNPASALKLGQARGVALASPASTGLSVYEYTANQVKKALVGKGHAAKQQIGMMVSILLPGCRVKEGKQPGADEMDALAVAICHAHHAPRITLNQEIRA